MLFWAGLRGAVGVALAAGLDDVNSSPTLKATVLIVVVLTVIIFGGTTARMLEIVGVRMNVVSNDVDSDEEDFMDHSTDLEETWHAVRRSTNGSFSNRSIPLETSAAISRAGQPYPLKDKSSAPGCISDPFSVSDEEENSDNESTASDQHVLTDNVIFVTDQNAAQNIKKNIKKNAEKNSEKNLMKNDASYSRVLIDLFDVSDTINESSESNS